MSAKDQDFTGRWLHQGEKFGQDFAHSSADYAPKEGEGSEGEVPMRHVHVEREGGKVGVWVPAGWTEEQARDALESNW